MQAAIPSPALCVAVVLAGRGNKGPDTQGERLHRPPVDAREGKGERAKGQGQEAEGRGGMRGRYAELRCEGCNCGTGGGGGGGGG